MNRWRFLTLEGRWSPPTSLGRAARHPVIMHDATGIEFSKNFEMLMWTDGWRCNSDFSRECTNMSMRELLITHLELKRGRQNHKNMYHDQILDALRRAM